MCKEGILRKKLEHNNSQLNKSLDEDILLDNNNLLEICVEMDKTITKYIRKKRNELLQGGSK